MMHCISIRFRLSPSLSLVHLAPMRMFNDFFISVHIVPEVISWKSLHISVTLIVIVVALDLSAVKLQVRNCHNFSRPALVFQMTSFPVSFIAFAKKCVVLIDFFVFFRDFFQTLNLLPKTILVSPGFVFSWPMVASYSRPDSPSGSQCQLQASAL